MHDRGVAIRPVLEADWPLAELVLQTTLAAPRDTCDPGTHDDSFEALDNKVAAAFATAASSIAGDADGAHHCPGGWPTPEHGPQSNGTHTRTASNNFNAARYVASRAAAVGARAETAQHDLWVSEQPWYHGSLSIEAAEDLCSQPGTYLARAPDSSGSTWGES